MAGQKTISTTYREPLPHPPHIFAYVVTGTMTPNCVGNYDPDGLYGGKLSYKKDGGGFYIFWNSSTFGWIIDTSKNNFMLSCWAKGNTSPKGYYGPIPPNTGFPLVT